MPSLIPQLEGHGEAAHELGSPEAVSEGLPFFVYHLYDARVPFRLGRGATRGHLSPLRKYILKTVKSLIPLQQGLYVAVREGFMAKHWVLFRLLCGRHLVLEGHNLVRARICRKCKMRVSIVYYKFRIMVCRNASSSSGMNQNGRRSPHDGLARSLWDLQPVCASYSKVASRRLGTSLSGGSMFRFERCGIGMGNVSFTPLIIVH